MIILAPMLTVSSWHIHQSLGHYSLEVDVKQSMWEQALEDSSSVLEAGNISAEVFVQVGGAVAYHGFLAPGARSGISAPFSGFFPQRKKMHNGWPEINFSHFQK